MTLTFGKYCGRKLCDVPTDYLEWLRQSSKKTVEAIDTELERRELAEMADEDWMGRIISAGFRSLSHKYHPDHGGSDEEMRELLAARARLRGVASVVNDPSIAA